MLNPILFELPMRVETARLVLRPPQDGDGEALLGAVTESMPELRQFLANLPWVAADQTLELSETYCRTGQSSFLARKDLPFLMFEKSSGQLLGGTGLHRTVWETPRTEVGYWCRTSRCGNGFVAEAVAALTDYAFRYVRAVRVELITDTENAPSRRVAERCGFALEGTLFNERRAPDGSLRNTCVYARVRNAT